MKRLIHGLAVLAVMPVASSASAQAVSAQTAANAPAQPYLTVAQLRAKYGDPAGKIATIKGVEIYYKDEGKGPVLLMVHGSASSLRTWDVIAARLKSRYRIIRFDVAAMGLSGSISDEAAATVTPVDIATGLMDKLGVKKLTYVGVSSGGTLGLYLAAARPDMVQRLILANTPADPVKYGHMVQPDSFLKAQEEAKKAGGFQSQTFWNEYLTYFAGDPARISAKKRAEYYDFNRRTPEKHPIALVAQIKDGIAANQAMAQVTAPTLLIWGGKDPLLTHAAMKSLEAHLPKAQVSEVILPDVGHYPPLEAPERVAQLISAYVEAAVPD
ncbi:MAG TPA: alpha/beta hydrolase [Sphingobium sp.]